MDAFDEVCPRCQGKGIEKPANSSVPATSKAPDVPVVPSVSIPGTTVVAGGGPGGIPPVIKFEDPNRRNPIPYLLGCIAYAGGYFLPWWQVRFLNKATISGQMNVEFLSVIGVACAAILMVADLIQRHKDNPLYPQLRLAISTACLAFAAGRLVNALFVSNLIQLSFGLPLMTIAAAMMVFLDFSQLDEDVKGANFGVVSVALVLVLGFAAYRGNEARKIMNIFVGIRSALGDNGTLDGAQGADESKLDVEVKINSVVQAQELRPVSDTWETRTPKPGKVFLICNVTVTFNGGTDSFPVTHLGMHLQASDKNIYNAIGLGPERQNVNELNARLLPGGSTTGDLVFEVASGAQPEKVTFSLN